MHDLWQASFQKQSPIFEPIIPYAQKFDTFSTWPVLNHYNDLLQRTHCNVTSCAQEKLEFVAQNIKPTSFEDEYEVKIYNTGEIQTRLNNWHDFFQVMTWCRYIETKKIINQLHAQAIISRKKTSHTTQRTSLENTLTLFDECGAIIVTSKDSLIQLIKSHSWKQLFINNRNSFNHELKCFIFGHALYEKSLNPYIGMTAHCIFLNVDKCFFNEPPSTQSRILDKLLSQYFLMHEDINTRILQPFPVLGVPGWDKNNINPTYYENKDYFRDKRLK